MNKNTKRLVSLLRRKMASEPSFRRAVQEELAKFEKGKSVPLSELPDELQENVENPPPSVKKLKEELKKKNAFKLKASDIKRTIETLLDNNGNDVDWREGYSGRGMFGRTSALAFTTNLDPRSDLGKKILAKYNLTYDNMGYDWIYYKQ